ncbi:otopetrin [Echinococcus multilocularis]|uniref:Otopetrin n=1 Tax=Echinococcus multilocularis TaxID=6211 RepID=A0A068Y2D9_ECHMU|nr:otopetrin [Echinococcus multilocularis]
MDEENTKPISMAPKKNRTNDRRSFCILYLSLMASASIAVAVQAMDEKDSLTAVVHNMLLGALYATSACVMFGATVYFAVKRDETFEAAQRISGPVSFIVKYSRCGEPVNLYLRLGLALFAAMSIGQSAIRLHEMQMEPPMHWPEVFKSTFEISFFAAQTLFILIYHRIVILHNNEIFGACFIHVLSTNLCMWADIMVDKVKTTLHLDHREGNSSGSSVSFYLLPAVSEYCLLSAALIYEITVRIGQPSYIELEEDEDEDDEEETDCVHNRGQGCLKKEREEGQETSEVSSKSGSISDLEVSSPGIKDQRRYLGCLCPRVSARSVKKVKVLMVHCGMNIKSGYWAPLLIVLTISALTVATGVTPKTSQITPWKCAVLFAEEMFLNCIGIFVTLASFFKIRHLKFTIASRQSVIDEFVLYIAFFFSANYLVATVALTCYFNRVTTDVVHKDLLMGRLALNMLELVEVILQTYLIQDCFRRCSEEDFQQRIKPSRQMIAVLLGINLAGWVVKSFQLKEADVLYNITVRNEIAYGWVLIAITMPVFLFYRYHCTVCLSQSFTMLYEDETRRFEALWRQNPIYLSNLLSHTNLAMCEDGDHFHARENLASMRMSNRQLSEMLHRKFSTQSFQQIEYMMPRRASFFHSGAISTSTTSMHDAELFPAQLHVAPPVHKLSSIHCIRKKLSVPNLKRVSVSGPKPSIKAAAASAISSRCRLAESESYEGPNYFLSRISPASIATPAVCNEHATQTTSVFLPNDHHHPTSVYHQQLQLSRPSTLRPPSSNRRQINNGIPPPEADGMQRRQTLVNLETAKYRYLAAEMAHKRVLERSVDGNGESWKKRAKSKRKRNKDEKSPVPRRQISIPTSSSGKNVPSTSPPLTTQDIAKPPTPPPTQPTDPPLGQPQQAQPPMRGFEPSKVVPLLIARNMVNTSDGGPLSAVPEEGGHDLSFTPSPPLIFSSSSSTTGRDTVVEAKAEDSFQPEEQNGDGDRVLNATGSPETTVSPASGATDDTELEYTSSISATSSATGATVFDGGKRGATDEK